MAEVSRKKVELEKRVPWSELPCLVLENIYSFLGLSDKAKMSMVCRKWSEAFESPSLWKRFEFRMSNWMISRENCFITKFARKYGRHFKHVQVYLDQTLEEQSILICCEHLETFLQVLRRTSQLYSFHFAVDCRRLSLSSYKNMCIEMGDFLGSQRNMNILTFADSFFRNKDGVDILKKSFENCKNSLKVLALADFFHYFDDNQHDSNVKTFLPTIFGLPNLCFLSIDYWLIFGKAQAILSDVIEKLSNFPKETKLVIWTNVDFIRQFKDFKLLTSSDWRHLKKLNPLLEIHMSVGRYFETGKPPEFIIIEDIPITWLEYVFSFRYSNNSSTIEIDEFLSRLLATKFNDYLFFFRLVWLKSIPDVESVFISFLKACKKLEILTLETVYPANHLDALLDSLLKHRPESLKKFKLKIYEVEKKHIKTLQKLCSEFMHRLKAVNLILELKIVETPYSIIT